MPFPPPDPGSFLEVFLLSGIFRYSWEPCEVVGLRWLCGTFLQGQRPLWQRVQNEG